MKFLANFLTESIPFQFVALHHSPRNIGSNLDLAQFIVFTIAQSWFNQLRNCALLKTALTQDYFLYYTDYNYSSFTHLSIVLGRKHNVGISGFNSLIQVLHSFWGFRRIRIEMNRLMQQGDVNLQWI